MALAALAVRQVCKSLQEAHSAGLVHRDIKPANIHVGRLGLQHDFVKVLDFGLVKFVAEDGSELSRTMSTGITPGTPAYMAPELASGETVDARTDIYSLGCVAYYLLTARTVFEADTKLQMVAKHLQSEPVPPSQRTGVELPPALERLVLACLAKEPIARPQSAAELDQLLADVVIEPWGEGEASRWWAAYQTSRPNPGARER